MEKNNLNLYNELHIGDIVGDTKRIVIACTKLEQYIPDDTYARWVAICVKDGEHHPYAIWYIVARPEGFQASFGDYAYTLQQALDVYYNRGGNRNA